jgi:hypothetical protein
VVLIIDFGNDAIEGRTTTEKWVQDWLDIVFDWRDNRAAGTCIVTADRRRDQGWYAKISWNDGRVLRSTPIWPIARQPSQTALEEADYVARVHSQCSRALAKLRTEVRGPAIKYTDEQIARWKQQAEDLIRLRRKE